MSALLFLIAPALAGDFELGVGVRDAQDDAGFPDGPRLVGRMPLSGGLVLEGGVFYRTSGDDLSGLDSTLIQIANGAGPDSVDFQQPVSRDLWSVSALLDYDFGGRVAGPGIQGGPHLYAGLEVRNIERGFGRYHAQAGVEGPPTRFDSIGTGVSPSLVLGSGIDVWIGQRIGWRFGWLNRLSLEDHPDYGDGPREEGKQVANSVTFTLDLLVGF
ncbi:MAG: hypothetical protein VX519_08150 [Myxococcota bacterium]|nr:hypothetical protein [Myxococcota bacterium]